MPRAHATNPCRSRAARVSALALGLSLAARGLQAAPGSPDTPDPTPAPPAKAKAADSDAEWKVEAAHGPTATVAFTTDEGTWLDLDLHPDGQRLVFSLLGDLYVLPAAGGEARRITSGPAYDVEPRVSPDGKWIAFASDRSGIEALWVCNLEGQEARQVSAEKSATVNGPAWTPDGAWLVGRKRLTDASSLGTVELWMWHVRGGEGVQVTKKDDQPDAADPAFSPDGRFLYYSARDARYRYNRNVNEGIWQIKRFDRKTGQTIPLTGEFGGSATPVPSPDGRSLAFTRRIRAKTLLQVMDLLTGAERTVASGLERDQQEGFSFHGVFPHFAWTADGTSIVATRDGRIVRIDVPGGRETPIPFTARVEQTVTEALHTGRRLGGDKVRARVLRWPVESPDGKTLVFEALGHLYAMDLPEGTPRRLTAASALEFSPAFSPDGARLAWVTWSDRDGGQVLTAPFGSMGLGAPQRVTSVAAQYANPSFSPDGKKLVFLKGSGATFRDNDLSDELWHEIHWAPAEGGPSTFVIGTKNRGPNRRMARPFFSSDGERIWFVEDEPAEKPSTQPKSLLVSVKLDGTDRRAPLRFTRGEEAVVSPDGRWVAFNELHNAWVTALPVLGPRTIDVDLDKPAFPAAQLTDQGGEWVSWVGGGRAIAWIAGPVYARLDLDRAFPPPKPGDAKEKEKDKDEEKNEEKNKKSDGKDKKKDLPKADKLEIVLEVPRARPSGTVAYTGARVVTMKGDLVLEGGTILVKDDRIAAVGPTGAVTVPPDATRVDVTGKTVVPGFFDEHAHLHYSTLDVFPERPWKYLANLAYGITTTHDPSASTQEVFGQSEMVEAGLMTGPRIFSTGYILYGADDPSRAVIDSLEDARKHLRRLKNLGAFTVKSYMQPRREQRQWIVKAAREEGMLVVPEGGGDLEMDMTMVLDGHTTIEHALPVAPLRQDVVTLLARAKTSYTPTLLVAYGGLSGDRWFHQHFELWKDEKLARYVPQGVLDTLGRQRLMAPDEDWHHLDVAASARDVLRAGGTVCLGGHGQMQGLGPHWEMWAFVQGGMTPLEALRVATLNPARTLGLDRDLGSIEEGKLADFVVLDRNPLEKIENTDSVSLVVKNGVAYDPMNLVRAPENPPGDESPGGKRQGR